MDIRVTPETLCELCRGHFTLEACKALCDYFDDLGSFDALSVGDLTMSYEEIPASWTDLYDDESLIESLSNGNVLVAR